jgi:hypothetical protein
MNAFNFISNIENVHFHGTTMLHSIYDTEIVQY